LLTDPTSADLVRRCELTGIPLQKRQLVGVMIRPQVESGSSRTPASLLDEVLSATVGAAREVRAPALVCEVDRDVRALLSLTPSANAVRIVDDLADRLRRYPVLVAAGRPVTRQADVDRTLRESQHVLQSLRPDAPRGVVHRL